MAVLIARTLIIYISLVGTMRILGKRQMGQLEISELVVAIVIADIAVVPLQDLGIPLINGLVPVFILLCCEILLTWLTCKSLRMRTALFGTPSTLIENGIINQREMKNNRFTIDELYEELRQQSITDISRVERAILETNGVLNVILFPKEQAATCKQLGIRCAEEACPTIIINEGKILENNLHLIGKDLNWLKRYLKHNHIRSASDVYLLSCDKNNQTYLSLMETDQ